MSNKINFFIPVDTDSLEKASKHTGEDRYRNMIVQGVASDSEIDSDGESLQPNGYILDRFLKYGYINYDHRSKDSSKFLIGEPIKAEVKDNKFFIKGKLYSDNQVARDLWDSMITLSKNSDSRKMGWSIEGKALSRDPSNPKIVNKALITGVALTPNPKNTNSYADIVKSINNSLKSGKEVKNIFEIVSDGLRYRLDKNFKLTIEKAVSLESAAALVRESVEGKLKKRDRKEILKALTVICIGAKNNMVEDKYINFIKNNNDLFINQL